MPGFDENVGQNTVRNGTGDLLLIIKVYYKGQHQRPADLLFKGHR